MAGLQPKTTLEKLILLKPDESWDWAELTYNHAVSLPFIEAHPSLPWDFSVIDKRKDLTDYYAEKFLCEPVTDVLAISNPGISADFLVKNSVIHSMISLSCIVDKPDFDPEFAFNAGIATIEEIWGLLPLQFLLANLDRLPDIDFEALSGNTTLTEEFIEENIDAEWQWGADESTDIGLSTNPILTLRFIESHMDKPWDWAVLSDHPCITEDFIESHPDLPWQWEYFIPSNKTFSLSFFLRNRHRGFSSTYLTQTLLETQGPSVLLNHQHDFEWDWDEATWLVPLSFINAHPDLPWNKICLFRNPQLTVQEIYRHDLLKYFYDFLEENPYIYLWTKWSPNPWQDILLLKPTADISRNPFLTIPDIESLNIPYNLLSSNWFETDERWKFRKLCKLQKLLKKNLKDFRRRRAYTVLMAINRKDQRLNDIAVSIVKEYL